MADSKNSKAVNAWVDFLSTKKSRWSRGVVGVRWCCAPFFFSSDSCVVSRFVCVCVCLVFCACSPCVPPSPLLAVTDLVDKDFKLVFIDTEARFGEVMWTLLDNNILSVPIFNKHTHKFVGAVDLLDLLTYAVTVFSETMLLSDGFVSHLRDEKKLDDEKYGVKFLAGR
jgi:hypothetical protein